MAFYFYSIKSFSSINWFSVSSSQLSIDTTSSGFVAPALYSLITGAAPCFDFNSILGNFFTLFFINKINVKIIKKITNLLSIKADTWGNRPNFHPHTSRMARLVMKVKFLNLIKSKTYLITRHILLVTLGAARVTLGLEALEAEIGQLTT